jgi:hypothetical protein
VSRVSLIVEIAVPKSVVNYLLNSPVGDAGAALAEKERVRLNG